MSHAMNLPKTLLLPLRAKLDRRRWAAVIGIWRRRARERQELLEMSDAQLKDIGISRYDAQCEGRKPFWRA